MKLLALLDSKESGTVLTPWSLLHAFYGFMHFAVAHCAGISDRASFYSMLVFHTLYEIKDLQYYFSSEVQLSEDGWGNNSLLNSIGDTICALIGYYVAVSKYKTICGRLPYFALLFILLLQLLLTYRLD